MQIPIESQRVNEVIKHFCEGNELLFSKIIGISQPRINRLFSIDPRNGKYPKVTLDIIQSIINKFIEVDAEWLVIGKGSMLKSHEAPPDNLIMDFVELQKKHIAKLELEIEELKKGNTSQNYGLHAAEPEPKLKRKRHWDENQ